MTYDSVLKQPLGKKIGARVLIFVLLGIGVLVLFPLLSSAVQWSQHRTVSYRGMSIVLPFGWVVRPDQLPLTVGKPWPSILTGTESDLLIKQENGVTDKNRDSFANGWTKLHEVRGEWIDLNEPQTPQRLTLRCSVDRLSGRKWLGVVRLECLSGDAEWTFSYFGLNGDMKQAAKLMQQVLTNAPSRQ